MKKTGKILAIFMVLLLLVQAIMPMYAFAQEQEAEALIGGSSFDYVAGVEATKLYSFVPSESARHNFYVHAPEYIDLTVYSEEDAFSISNWEYGTCTVGVDLVAGQTYYACVSINGEYDGSASIHAVLAPAVESIEITEYPENTTFIFEKTEDDTAHLGYYGLRYTVHFDNESFYDADWNTGMVNGYYTDIYTIVDPESADFGKTVIDVDGKTATFKMNLIENPVAKIEYVGKPIEFTENTNGHIDENEDGEYFRYYTPDALYEGKAIKLTFKDGKTKLINFHEVIVGEENLWLSDDQNTNPWKAGADNYFEILFYGVSCKVPVKITKMNVKSIRIISNPTTQYMYGDGNGYFYDGLYWLWIDDVDGLAFEVTYTDNKKEVFYGEDVDLYRDKLGDNYFRLEREVEVDKPGTYDVKFNFQGFESSFKVVLKESNVKSFVLTKAPDLTTVPEGFDTGYLGAEFKITYKDNKTETVKLTKENVVVGGDFCAVEFGDNYIEINREEGEGGIKTYAYFRDLKCELPNVVRTQPLDVVDLTVKNADDRQAMEFTIEFANGSKETFKSDIVEIYGGIGGDPDYDYDIFATSTKYGLMTVSVTTRLEAGLAVEREVYAFGRAYHEELNQGVTLSKIEISSKPNVVRYEKGEEFDPSGLVVKTFFTNGDVGYLDYDWGYGDKIAVSDVDTSKEGTKTVTVTFEGKTATFTIEVGGSFKDVKKGAWYEQYVDYATKYGIFNGTGNGNFSPDAKLSRAQFVQVLANIEGVDLDNNMTTDFKDVASGKWYTGAVAWAAENKIVSGSGDGKFNPNADVSREQMCVILVNFMEKYWMGEFNKNVIATKFADDAQISSWAKDSVYTAFRAGLVTGTGSNKFSPKLSATRSQGATIFTKFHDEYIAW